MLVRRRRRFFIILFLSLVLLLILNEIIVNIQKPSGKAEKQLAKKVI